MLKLRNLCKDLPKSLDETDTRRNLAEELFTQYPEPFVYVQTADQAQLEEHYSLKVNPELLEQAGKSKFKPILAKYGKNEQYLSAAAMGLGDPLMVLVGGIGVGKTSFLREFFLREVIRDFAVGQPSCPHKPIAIYYSVTQDYDPLDEEDDDNRSESRARRTDMARSFEEPFVTTVLGEITAANLFSIDQEITEVWGDILKNAPAFTSTVIHWLRRELSVAHATDDDYKKNPSKGKRTRLKILNAIRKDPHKALFYCAHLLDYIKRRFFAEQPLGVCVIVDNIDRLKRGRSLAIQIVSTFARISKIRVILAVRQSTFFQDVDDRRSTVTGSIPYCGPSPIEVIQRRLNWWLHDDDQLRELILKHGSGPGYQALIDSVKALRRVFGHPRFQTFFAGLAGRSVRRGLVLAKRTVAHTRGEFGKNEITQACRALIAGVEGSYSDAPNNPNDVENIFDLVSNGKTYPLLKLRILEILRNTHDNRATVGEIREALRPFGYNNEVILAAINALKRRHKRLIWCDQVADEIPKLNGYKHCFVTLTSIGLGIVTDVVSRNEYMEEVMLDTSVEGDIFGSDDWEYKRREQRIALLGIFMRWLVDRDVAEMEQYADSGGTPETYERHFGVRRLLTKQLAESLKESIDALFRGGTTVESELAARGYLERAVFAANEGWKAFTVPFQDH